MAEARTGPREPDGQTVRLEVPARPGYVGLARLALSAVCRLTPLRLDEVADLKLAVTEAAATFVGDDGERAAPSGSEHEQTLKFTFDIKNGDLNVEIACDAEAEPVDRESDLSRAIIEATVDGYRSEEGSIHLVKHLARETAGRPGQ